LSRNSRRVLVFECLINTARLFYQLHSVKGRDMTKRIFLFLAVLLCFQIFNASPRAQSEDSERPEIKFFTDADLDVLFGPIALYPDPLLAVLLPASTHPVEVVVAARYLDNGGRYDQIEEQNWSDSVKALAHYPEVIRWMDENIEWTTQVGNAFLAQPEDVINAIQRLRSLAQSLGNLTTTPEQIVEISDGAIDIIPVEGDVIYQPTYDPYVVFTRAAAYGAGPYVSFQRRLPMGGWLKHDWDWRSKRIVVWQKDSFRPKGWWAQPCKTRFASHKFSEWAPPRRGQVCSKFWTSRQQSGATRGARSSTGGGGSTTIVRQRATPAAAKK
jgi:hypothetical protein